MGNKNPFDSDLNSIGSQLNENLSYLMEKNNVTLSVLHRNTGVAIPTIKRLQSDPTTNPTITTLIPIANFFGVSIAQLIGYEPIPATPNGYVENKNNWLHVPIITWDQIINWENNKFEKSNFSVSTDIDVGDKPYALNVEEDDWVLIPKNSILIINSNIHPEHKDFAIVNKIGYGTPTLKQVMIDQGKIYLKSMNPHYSPTLFDDDHAFHGVLMQIRKDRKV